MKKTIIEQKEREITVCDFCGGELPENGYTVWEEKEYHNSCFVDKLES